MRNQFTFESESFEFIPEFNKESESEFEEENFLGAFPSFLQWFGQSSDNIQINDRTAFSPKKHRLSNRDIKKVYALVLHQTAFSRGSDLTKYDNIPVHFVIVPDGGIIQLHPITAYLPSSNGFNAGSVAVEFVGNFPNTKGKCWEAKKFGCHRVSQAQVDAGRALIKYLIKQINLTHVLAHRQSSASRENDPGPDIWYHVGQWAIDNHGLKDGGSSFSVGSGKPIPEVWRTWGKSNPLER